MLNCFNHCLLAGETDAVNNTTVSAIVSEQPQESERVPESDDDFSSPSLGTSDINITDKLSSYSLVYQAKKFITIRIYSFQYAANVGSR